MNKGRKEERKIQANERQDKYDKLTVKEKIVRAKSRRGKSEKEIKRLMSKHRKGNNYHEQSN
jgi:DNA-binding CsgD family transcriptional regulator